MKIKILLIGIILTCSLLTAQAQDSMFDRLSDRDDISTVYISKALLKMMPDTNIGGNIGGTNIKGLANKLEQMEIYSGEGNTANEVIRKEVRALVKSKSYETLMAIQDKGQNINFYVQKEKNLIKDLVMFINDDKDQCMIIRIMGSFTTEDIQKVVEGSGK